MLQRPRFSWFEQSRYSTENRNLPLFGILGNSQEERQGFKKALQQPVVWKCQKAFAECNPPQVVRAIDDTHNKILAPGNPFD